MQDTQSTMNRADQIQIRVDAHAREIAMRVSVKAEFGDGDTIELDQELRDAIERYEFARADWTAEVKAQTHELHEKVTGQVAS